MTVQTKETKSIHSSPSFVGEIRSVVDRGFTNELEEMTLVCEKLDGKEVRLVGLKVY